MNASNFSDDKLSIGAVFTPGKWAKFAIERFGLFPRWLEGARIFDPTMGEGNLLEAFLDYGREKGWEPDQLPWHRLYGVELNKGYLDNFFLKIKQGYSIELERKNFQNKDIFFLNKEEKYDIIFGNPPWQNFVDLPQDYKEKLKPLFFQYDLVSNAKNLLLGRSRMDISALVINKTIKQNLREKGEAFFFAPLSLFFNDGANEDFRNYRINSTFFRLNIIYDLNNLNVFPNQTTRYGLVHFTRDEPQKYPLEYLKIQEGRWKTYQAQPLFNPLDPLSVLEKSQLNSFQSFTPLRIKKESMPRQGVNTCGGNKIYIFDSCQPAGRTLCRAGRQGGETFLLPQECLFPLITAKNFTEDQPQTAKWILLPYNRGGKPFSQEEMTARKELCHFLSVYKEQLTNRRGAMIRTWINRGIWWALLGVGEYNFFPYKVIWEAYGRKKFTPRIFPGEWQGNQSLQAYIPVRTKKEGEKILKKLKHPLFEEYLLSLNMEGTKNWAQPGKIKKLITYLEDPSPS